MLVLAYRHKKWGLSSYRGCSHDTLEFQVHSGWFQFDLCSSVLCTKNGCQVYIYDAKQNIGKIWKISQQEYQDGCMNHRCEQVCAFCNNVEYAAESLSCLM